MTRTIRRIACTTAAVLALVAGTAVPASAAGTAVSVPGDFESEIGCAGDWDPGCALAQLAPRSDGFWSLTVAVPAGDYRFKTAIDRSWDVNYGAGGVANGLEIPLHVPDGTPSVTFVYDPATHVTTATATGRLAVAAGSFQSELGCASDWQPDCLASWLQDADGDGVATLSAALPAGAYEAKIALGLGWDENYGRYGKRDGANIPFTVAPTAATTAFAYDTTTHYVEIGTGIAVAVGSFQSELGCSSDWQPDCLRSWLRDPDGDGVATLTKQGLPPGRYDMKVALGTTWDVNYGGLGRAGGANIPFTVKRSTDTVTFVYLTRAHLLTAIVTPAVCPSGTVKLLGFCVPKPPRR